MVPGLGVVAAAGGRGPGPSAKVAAGGRGPGPSAKVAAGGRGPDPSARAAEANDTSKNATTHTLIIVILLIVGDSPETV